MGGKGWRLILDGRNPGSFNMALDEALMQCCRNGSPPTLRLYGWSPACLSVGYFQSVEQDIDLQRCQALGIDLVRRPTGGRAVLHDDEMTYSVTGSLDDPRLSGSVNESYARIAAGIREGLSVLGLEVDEPAPGARVKTETGACFEAVWGHELTVEGRKIVASAQTRRGGVVLQHGSILLSADPGRLAAVFRTADKHLMEAMFRRRLITLSDLLRRTVCSEEVTSAIRRGFERALGVTLEVGKPSDEELALATRLVAEKYGNPAWTFSR